MRFLRWLHKPDQDLVSDEEFAREMSNERVLRDLVDIRLRAIEVQEDVRELVLKRETRKEQP